MFTYANGPVAVRREQGSVRVQACAWCLWVLWECVCVRVGAEGAQGLVSVYFRVLCHMELCVHE